MFTAWADELRAWRRERFPARLFLPFALALSAGGLSAAPGADATELAPRVATALVLLLQFRLWDDLADRERDRIDHPGRVLCRAHSLAPFHALLFASGALAFALVGLLAPPPGRLATLLALDVAFAAWYGRLRRGVASDIGAAHVVLVKYPIFVYLLRAAAPGPAAPRLLLIMGAAYLALALYELLDDPRLRRAAPWRRLVRIEVAALSTTVLLLVIDIALGDET